MDMTPEAVQQRLQDFYAADGSSREIGDLALLGSGFETDVFVFTLRSAESEPQELILRVFAGEGCAEKAEREFNVMRRLGEIGYPVPRVLELHPGPGVFERPFIVMERIYGVSLNTVYWEVPEERRQTVQETLYRLIAQLHALDGPIILPESPLAASRDPYGPIDRELAALRDLQAQLDGRDPPSLRKALDWLDAGRSRVGCDQPVLVHGDFHRNNVLARPDGAHFVIDWSNVKLGDRRSELGWTRVLTGLMGDQPEGASADLRLYEQYAGVRVERIEYFEAATCVKMLLSDLNMLYTGAGRQGLRPGVEEDIRANPGATMKAAVLLEERTGIRMADVEDTLAGLISRE